MWDRLLVDCHVATMDPAVGGPFGAIPDGAVERILDALHDLDIAAFPAYGTLLGEGIELVVDSATHIDTDAFSERLRRKIPDIERHDVFLCGPPGFAQGVYEALRGAAAGTV